MIKSSSVMMRNPNEILKDESFYCEGCEHFLKIDSFKPPLFGCKRFASNGVNLKYSRGKEHFMRIINLCVLDKIACNLGSIGGDFKVEEADDWEDFEAEVRRNGGVP
jgi:hypothetical protein